MDAALQNKDAFHTISIAVMVMVDEILDVVRYRQEDLSIPVPGEYPVDGPGSLMGRDTIQFGCVICEEDEREIIFLLLDLFRQRIDVHVRGGIEGDHEIDDGEMMRLQRRLERRLLPQRLPRGKSAS